MTETTFVLKTMRFVSKGECELDLPKDLQIVDLIPQVANSDTYLVRYIADENAKLFKRRFVFLAENSRIKAPLNYTLIFHKELFVLGSPKLYFCEWIKTSKSE